MTDSYMKSLGSVAMQHEGADHHMVTPQSQVGPGEGYQAPVVAIQHPGLAKVATGPVAPQGPTDLQNGLAGAVQAGQGGGMQAPQVDPYQAVQFVQPDLQQYQPQYQNLSHLLQGG